MGSVSKSTQPSATLERDHILQEIFDNIENFASNFSLVDFGALKYDVIGPVLSGNFNPEIQLRGFLKAFQHTLSYQTAFREIGSEDLKHQINQFIEGSSCKEVVQEKGFEVARHPSPGAKHHFSLLETIKQFIIGGLELKEAVEDVFHPEHKHVKNLPIVYEDRAKSKIMEVYGDVPFENWGLSVKNVPRYTFVPTTVLGIQNLVQYARANNFRVRCGGYRHSWSSIFSQDSEILVSFVDLKQVTTLPDPMSLVPGEYNPTSVPELKTIELQEQKAADKCLCRVGVAVTGEEFRRWAVANDAWSLPVDAILVEVTMGGVNGSICHGAGRHHKAISDYVRRVEYVDCHGNHNIVDDPYLIKAAAGSFGLMGVVTHLTFELDKMTYAIMKPLKVDIGLAIPPASLSDIPQALRSDWIHSADASQQLASALSDFENRATNDYYSEWFWFTYQRKAWVNTWNTTSSSTSSVEYPSPAQTFLQWVEGWIGGVLTSTSLFQAIPGYWQAQLLATMGMAALPPTFGEDQTPEIKTSLPNALHFRRGVQNMRVRDLELQIPLTPRKDDPTKPDFAIVRRAWWDVIKLVYAEADSHAEDPSTPMRLTLELRIMGGSDVLMAPQKGNDLGTASIEVLSIPDAVEDKEWQGFLQKVVDIWMGYKGLNVRPHWAKEWEGLTFRGMEARDYMKKVGFKEQIVEFKEALGKIGAEHGWGTGDLQQRFSNELWDNIVFDV